MTEWYEREEITHSIWQTLKTTDGLTYYYNRETKEVTWDCPPELQTSSYADSGDWYWVPSTEHLFIPATKTGPNAFQTEDGSVLTFSKSIISQHVYPLKRSSLERIVDDLVLLDDLHSPLILYNLKKRFDDDKIYTYIGNILISVNPYQYFPIYTNEVADEYQRALRNFETKPPHVFKVADDAFRRLSTVRSPQSIIISGDSGSGKTEATKQCLKYLARISTTDLELGDGTTEHANVEERILRTNPVLESFGNAKTIRNDNSSRFGKYIKIFFEKSLSIVGAKIDSYLLEKIRVVKQAQNERNYHVFYQLLSSSLSDNSGEKLYGKEINEFKKELRKECLLLDENGNNLFGPNDFIYTGQSGCDVVPSINDVKDFTDNLTALEIIGFSYKEASSIFRLVSAVLHLGNISYLKASNDSCTIAEESNYYVQSAAYLMGLTEQNLIEGLSKKRSKVSGESIVASLRIEQAENARASLSKILYSRLFSWLVLRTNQSLSIDSLHSSSSSSKVSGKEELFIGILDIFGFEIFEQNSLEQLCINFTNERLQALFNLTVFKNEERLYKTEGVDVGEVPFYDNQAVIDIIGDLKGTKSIFGLISEEVKLPGGNTAGLYKKMKRLEGEIFKLKFSKRQKEVFVVKHYAGEVEYEPTELLEKNKDALPLSLLELVLSSNLELMGEIFKEDKGLLDDSFSGRGMALKKSLVSRFGTELASLMKSLHVTTPHYIRCVKPNDNKAANEFDSRRSYEQLLYAGVFEAVKIRKTGFPFNCRIDEFCSRYGVVFTANKGLKMESKYKGKNGALEIVKQFNLKGENVKVGKTRVFYRSNEYRTMELKWSIVTERTRINKALNELCTSISGFPENGGERQNKEKERLLENLVKYILRAEELNFQSEYTTKADSLYEKAVESRIDPNTARRIEEALVSKDEGLLEELVKVIDEKRYRTRKCTKLKRLYAQVQEINILLVRANRRAIREELQECITKAEEIPLEREKSVNLNTAYLVIENIDYIENVLSNVFGLTTLEATNIDELRGEIERATTINYNSPSLVKAKLYVQRAAEIDSAISLSLERLYEDELRKITFAGDEINYKNRQLIKAKNFVKMPKSSIRKDQLRAACRDDDKERVFWLTVEIKNEVTINFRDNYDIANFGGLIGASAFSKYKLFGRSELQETYLSFSKRSIPHSLSQLQYNSLSNNSNHNNNNSRKERNDGDRDLEKKLQKLTLKIFKAIQIYMGDRAESKKLGMRESLLLILSSGTNYPAVRDEIFLQVLKQLTRNPNKSGNSVQKGKDLLKIIINSFPPSEEFQVFLEAFIINHLSEQKNTYLYMLHYKCYHAEIVQGVKRDVQRLKIPTDNEISEILGKEYATDIQEPKPHKIPTEMGRLEVSIKNQMDRELYKLKNERRVSVAGMGGEEMLPPPPGSEEFRNAIPVMDAQQGGEGVGDNMPPDLDALIESDDEDNEAGPPPV